MGKKDSLEDLLDILSPGSRKDQSKEPPNFFTDVLLKKQEEKKTKKNDGILSPIMNNFTVEQKFSFISSLMDFTGDFLIKLIDYYGLELSKIENSISIIQSRTLNQIRTTRTQIIKARQDGLLVQQKKPQLATGRQFSMAAATQGAPASPSTGKHQPTKEDVQNIALQIRQLIKRQKESRSSSSEIMGIKVDTLKEGSLSDIKKSTIESKLAEYKKSQTEQEERLKKKVKTTTTRKKTSPRKKSTRKSKEKTVSSTKESGVKTGTKLPDNFKESLISNIKVKLKDLEEELDDEEDYDEAEEDQEE